MTAGKQGEPPADFSSPPGTIVSNPTRPNLQDLKTSSNNSILTSSANHVQVNTGP